MTHELLAPRDPRWTALLERVPHDVYHRPGYLAFAARHEGGCPLAVLVEQGGHRLLAPLLVRSVGGEGRDAFAPYGYGSPLLTPGASQADAAVLLDGLIRALASEGIVSAFFRLHTILPLPAEPLMERGDLVVHGETVHLEVRRSDDEVLGGFRRQHRQGINRLRAAGYRLAPGALDASFVAIYHETMERVGADPFYRFPRAYFDDLKAALGDSVELVTVRAPDGALAAAGMLSVAGEVAQFLFSATAGAHAPLAPSKLLALGVARRARERGARTLNVGGGVGCRRDTLHRFKAGFSGLRGTFATWRVVVDRSRYARLVAGWERSGGVRAPEGPDYFPLYRKPLPVGGAA